MPWIYKINVPKFNKGDLLKKKDHDCLNKMGKGPLNFPDLFEFVEEKSDKDVLTEFLFKGVTAWSTSFCPGGVAEKLISENAIKPEFLKKLRRS